MPKRVLVTGGAGFIGSHLCDELLQHGYRVRALDALVPQVHGPDRMRPAYLDADVELVVGDVRDRDLLRRSLDGVDSVVHLVAAVGVGQSMYEIEHYTSTNGIGTAILLELLAERPVERLLVASSMSIYGEGAYRGRGNALVEAGERPLAQLRSGQWEVVGSDGTPLRPVPTPETKQPRPTSVYALSKYDQERLCLMVGQAYGISASALRFFNVFGPRQALSNPYTGVLAIFSACCLAGKAPRIFEDGRQQRDFVSVHDIARACRLALESPSAAGEVVNVGSGRSVTITEVAERIAATLGIDDLEPVVTREYRVGDIRHCFADISKARRMIGYEPQVSFEDGLRELADWLATQQPAGSPQRVVVPAQAGAANDARAARTNAQREARTSAQREARTSAEQELMRRGLVVGAGSSTSLPKRARPGAAGRRRAASGERASHRQRGANAPVDVARDLIAKGAADASVDAPAEFRGDSRSRLGLVEWFRINDHDKVERVLADLEQLGIGRLRTGISWADWHRPDGKAWYDWLLPHLAAHAQLLPCVMYTPPSLGIAERVSSPPRDPKMFADFVDVLITDYGAHFDTIELWTEPTNPNHWERSLDPDWSIFCDMIRQASYWAKHRGKQTVLGGVGPADFEWFRIIGEQGALDWIDVVGVHAHPGTWEQDSRDLPAQLGALAAELEQLGSARRIWITEAAYSTWQQDEHRQLLQFLRLVESPVERVYWSSVEDVDPEDAFADGWEQDERYYHYGLKRLNGSPKLLYRVLSSGGLPAATRFVRFAAAAGRDALRDGAAPSLVRHGARRSAAARKRPVLVFGGAGFIGTNLCSRLLDEGSDVMVFDNLSRPGIDQNLEWLQETYGERVQLIVEDVRDGHAVRHAVERASAVFHLAAQVAVTTSLVDPLEDFSVNAAGTLNVLEACRRCTSPPPLLFTSTNKVYGCLADLALRLDGECYVPLDEDVRRHGVSEKRPLDFQSPYGCSKGVADQYVLDFARCYRLPAVVLRMSCIYGPHQWGNEDQGWVAHFVRQLLEHEPITIYGDGFQVRDALYVDDLVDAMLGAVASIRQVAGRAFNIGGGPGNTISPAQVLAELAELHGEHPVVEYGAWRQGDQKYYVSDSRAFAAECEWQPRVAARDGIARLYRWLGEHRPMPAPHVARAGMAALVPAS